MSNNGLQISPAGPVGIFDSGFGGLTVLKEIRHRLPDLDYLYLGDNARAPYGTRSFDLVYRFTLEGVNYLFDRGCPLVILACNTASAKALRTIQQNDLPRSADPTRRVLGVIRPTAEFVGQASKTGEASGPGADYFVNRDVNALIDSDPLIDTVILGCTHYPILAEKIRRALPDHITMLSQGAIVADSLADYLRRHPEMDCRLSRGGTARFFTTEDPTRFDTLATIFTGHPVTAERAAL